MKLQIAICVLAVFWPGISVAQQTYERVMAGKECKVSSAKKTTCRYKVGETLDLMISGIGTPDAMVAFLKSDIDGDFYASYSMKYKCVFVRSGMEKKGARRSPFTAFISLKNGEVYSDRVKCKTGYSQAQPYAKERLPR